MRTHAEAVEPAGRPASVRRKEPPDALARLQRDAGNRAVTAALSVQRDGYQPPPNLLGDYHLRLDPELQARFQAQQTVEQLLDPAAIQAALLQLPAPAANPLAGPSPAAPTPLVPAGDGPATAHAADTGDLLGAVMGVPAISNALASLQNQAVDRVSHDFHSLRTGGQVATVSVLAVIAGVSLGGALAHAETRDFLLSQLNGRVLPVPGVAGLGVELNTERDNVMVAFHLDVGRLLPPWLGFGPADAEAIGGPPGPGGGD
jgi:hypothetical protein